MFGQKGINPIISAVLVLIISVTGISLVLDVGMPAVERSRENALFDEARRNINLLRETLEEIEFGANGTSRTVALDVTDGAYSINGSENSISFSHQLETSILSPELCHWDGNVLTRTFGSGRVLDTRFKEGEGNETMDCSRHENDGKIKGANWTETSRGKVLQFDGVDDEVVVPDDASLDKKDFTVTAWVNWRAGPEDIYSSLENEGSFIFGALENYGLAAVEDGGEIYIKGGFYDEESNDVAIKSNETLDNHTWYHTAFVYDVESEEARIYIDGELSGNISHDTPPKTDDKNKSIGYVPDSIKDSYGPWEGYIDDVRLYERSLPEEKVEVIYRGGSLGSQERLDIKLPFKEVDLTNSTELNKGRHNLLVKNRGQDGKVNIETRLL
ncbi:MAG: LamG domain-containing protein [Candidatus Aenigmatarchaeota archaeon]